MSGWPEAASLGASPRCCPKRPDLAVFRLSARRVVPGVMRYNLTDLRSGRV